MILTDILLEVLLVCRAEGVNLLIPVAVLHFAAFTMGYWLSKGLKFNEKTARTVSIETGTASLSKCGLNVIYTHMLLTHEYLKAQVMGRKGTAGACKLCLQPAGRAICSYLACIARVTDVLTAGCHHCDIAAEMIVVKEPQ